MNDFIELTRSKMAAVVQISVEGYFGEEVQSILNPKLGDLKLWTGSGFFIKCDYGDDIIVTNAHVVKNAKTIEISSMLTSEEKFEAELVAIVKDHEPDVAIIRLKKGELTKLKKIAVAEIPYLSLRECYEIPRGTMVKAIGYPMGMGEPNITGGEITNFISGNQIIAEKYVTDAAINPGNSGGPAIDKEGNVVGINTSIIQAADNIGFITPANFISIILKNIFENNSIFFADFGGNFQKNSKSIADQLNMKEAMGVIVNSVEESGFLAKTGVKAEDVILSVNGEGFDRHGNSMSDEFYHRRNIFDTFKLIPIGEVAKIGVWRDGKELLLEGKVLSAPEKKLKANPLIIERSFLTIWGMTIQVLSYEIVGAFNIVDNQIFYDLLKNFDENQECLIITHIEKGSPCYSQEWSIGEVIKTVNGKKIEGMKQFLELIEQMSGTVKVISDQGAVAYYDAKEIPKPLILQCPADFLS